MSVFSSTLATLELALFSSIVRPLAALVPKDPELVAFMPQSGRRFFDNTAHFYEHLRVNGKLPKNSYWLTWRKKGRSRRLRMGRSDVRQYDPYAWRELFLYLRTSVIIADHRDWTDDKRVVCFAGAKKVQIWHGIPLKEIELIHRRSTSKFSGLVGRWRRVGQWFKGRYPNYDLVVSTSEFFSRHAFSRAFRSRSIVITGYPRNDYLFLSDEECAVRRIDTDSACLARINKLRARGTRIVLYVPTFRDSGNNPLQGQEVSLADLERLGHELDATFVVKLHPRLARVGLDVATFERVLVYSSAKDVAPLLRVSDVLITDYSSVFFDYLLLNRPVIFFAYDREKYFAVDRQFMFDYDEFTPGPKCYSLVELTEQLRLELSKPSAMWSSRREELRNRCFSYADGHASERLFRAMSEL